MDLILTKSKYRKFLIEFRQADQDNADTNGETEVVFEGNKRYYFRAPNFCLVAYDIGGGRVNLTDYNHVTLSSSKGIEMLKSDLRLGGGTSTNMNQSLSTVVAATSEAARSKVVEAAFQRMIDGATINLHQYEIIFKAYNQPARFNGLLNNDGSYKPSWRALKKEDYLHFINSSEYKGDSTGMREKITPL